MPRPVSSKPAEVEPEVEAEVPEPEVEPDEAATDDATDEDAPRTEKFEATRPDGEVVVVERNIDTGDQTVTSK